MEFIIIILILIAGMVIATRGENAPHAGLSDGIYADIIARMHAEEAQRAAIMQSEAQCRAMVAQALLSYEHPGANQAACRGKDNP